MATVILPRKDKARYNYNEGTYVFYRNGLYYFTWSENDTRSKNYRIRYAISDSPTSLVRNGQPVAAAEKTIVLQRDDENQIFGTGHHAILQKPGTDALCIIVSSVRVVPNSTGVLATTARCVSIR